MKKKINQENTIFITVQDDCPAPEWLDKIQPFVMKVLEKLEYNGWEISVMFCKDPFIQELNKQYRELDMPTDVLSFEQGDVYVDEDDKEWFAAGDIVISVDTLARNAQEFNVTMDEELKRLLIHGVLHLAGYDHSDNSPEQEMLKFQETILSNFLDNADIIIDK